MRKYELTSESIVYDGIKLYRIKALRDFGDVKIGDLGGFVESERNLSHNGNCWIYDWSLAFDTSIVRDNAKLRGCAKATADVEIGGDEIYYNYTLVSDKPIHIPEFFTEVHGNAKVN